MTTKFKDERNTNKNKWLIMRSLPFCKWKIIKIAIKTNSMENQ